MNMLVVGATGATGRLQLSELQLVSCALDVHLLEQPSHRVLRAHAALDQAQARTQHVAKGPELVGDHMRLGQQVSPEQLGEHTRIGAVGLHLRRRDGLDALGVCEAQRYAGAAERVLDPVPSH